MRRTLVLLLVMSAPSIVAGVEDQRSSQVDALFSAWDKPGSPGCAAGVMTNGRLVYAKGFGLADVARGTPLSPDTVFDVASMAKQFTAASVALLILDRQLALREDVRDRFPELHLEVPVTVDNLLHHTSGLRDYAELNQLRGTEPTDNSGVITLLSRQKTLNFSPGSEHAYSNSNYVVLAELVQRATGKSLAALSSERIFGPLKMKSTRYGGNLKDDPAGLAISYISAGMGRFTPVARNSQSVGDGNLLTTVRDLASWDENFYANRVGGKALARLMRTPATLRNGELAPYGFGLMLDTYRGQAIEHHGGSFHGFRTELLRFPQQHFSVSVLCNVASANASGLSLKVADIYLADALQPRASGPPTGAADVNVRSFDSYVGDYLVDFGGPLVVLRFRRDGDQLFVQSPAGAPNELLAISGTELVERSGRGRITFQREAGGAVRLTLHREEADLVGRKISISTPSSDLATKIAGVYYSEEADAELRVQSAGDRVVAQIGPERKLPIVQIGERQFLLPGGAVLEYSQSVDGDVLDYSSTRVAHLRFARRGL